MPPVRRRYRHLPLPARRLPAGASVPCALALCALLAPPPGRAETVSSVVSGGWIMNGMTQDVVAGGVAVKVQVDGTQNVSAGGVARGTFGTGEQNIYAGGQAFDTAMTGTQNVFSGGFASATTVLGLRQNVYGGQAVGTTLRDGGTQQVSGGGVAISTTLVSGSAGQAVLAGGSASQTMIGAGGIQTIAGGSATQTVVSSGGLQQVFGGEVSATTLLSGAEQRVQPGGTARQTTVNAGASQRVAGVAIDNQVDGGSQTVFAGGSVSATTITRGGNQTVSSGGLAIQTRLLDGDQTIASGGEARDTLVASGNDQTVVGIASATTLQSGARQFVSAGGSALQTQIDGGAQQVFAGGLVSATTLNAGSQRLESGAQAIATTVNRGADQIVYGSASGNVVNGGRQFVYSGGRANDNTVDGGTQQVENGGVVSATTLTRASQFVLSGGQALATRLLAGGRQTVSSGGVADGVQIESGGTAQVTGGELRNATLAGNAGRLILSRGTLAGTTQISGNDNQLILLGGRVDGSLGVAGSGNLVALGNADLASWGTLRDDSAANTLSVLSGSTIVADSAAARPGVLSLQNWSAIRVNRGGTLTLAGELALASGGTLAVSGTLAVPQATTVDANVSNAGLLALAAPLTIRGDYTGVGGQLQDEVSAGGASADVLTVNGSASGVTPVRFVNDGSRGRLGERIVFANVMGSAQFVAANPVGARNPYDVRLTGSPYVWQIVRDGNSWLLEAPAAAEKPPLPEPPTPATKPASPLTPDRLLPEIPAYGTLPALSDLILRGNLMSLGQRLDTTASVKRDLWLKVDGFHLQQSARYGFAFSGEGASLTGGVERDGELANGARWRAGVFAAWNRAWLDVNGEGRVIPSRATSKIHLDSLQAGVYGQLTQDGWFGRAIALGGRERAKISTEDRYFNTLHATIWALHLAAGKVLTPAPGWRVIPQLNASYGDFDWSLVDDSIKGRYDKTQHVYGGAGVRVEKTIDDTLSLWLRPGVTHQFGSAPLLALSAPDVSLPAAGPATTWQLQAGFNRDTRWGGYYGLLGGSWGSGQQQARVEAGWRWLW